jgi:chaperonin GroES
MIKTPCPLGKRVLLVKDDAPETSEGGIVLPSDSQEKPLTAHVIDVGNKVTQLSKGDEVIYASFAGTTFNIGGKEVIVVDEEDIMLVLREVPDGS